MREVYLFPITANCVKILISFDKMDKTHTDFPFEKNYFFNNVVAQNF
jgi:hypothetical protein